MCLKYCDITAEAGIVEQVKAAIARQWHSKHVSMATDTDVTIDNSVSSICSMPRLYNEDQQQFN
jgi:hypothetical protein